MKKFLQTYFTTQSIIFGGYFFSIFLISELYSTLNDFIFSSFLLGGAKYKYFLIKSFLFLSNKSIDNLILHFLLNSEDKSIKSELSNIFLSNKLSIIGKSLSFFISLFFIKISNIFDLLFSNFNILFFTFSFFSVFKGKIVNPFSIDILKASELFFQFNDSSGKIVDISF
ncbi:MAG: hypothetical protein Q9M97_06160 [Candidatus Gracilibacteria bacterium]|nr:hypothetical protein [Candidatus Gracilibacteria bacterium]